MVNGKSLIQEFLEFAIGIIGILLVIYLLCGFALNIIVDKLPGKFERHMVRLIDMGDFETPFYLVEAEIQIQELLNELVALSSLKGGKYTFILNESEEVNARALPGNNVVLYSGLINKLRSENELAFFLAHQLGHFHRRDQLRGLGRGSIFVFLSANVFGINSGVTQWLVNMIPFGNARHSQKEELEADAYAIRLLNKKYGHIAGGKDFFQRLKKTKDPHKVMGYLSTHSLHQKRIIAIDEMQETMAYIIGVPTPLDPDIFRKH